MIPTNETTESLRERCSRYLLGEMSGDEQQAFESQLGDTAVADALLEESCLIDQIASANVSGSVVVTNKPTRTHTHSFFTLVVSTAAIITLVVGAYWAVHSNSQNASRPVAMNAQVIEMAIATTWAADAGLWESQLAESHLPPTSLGDPEELLFESNGDISATDDEDAFDWIVAAVEASSDSGPGSESGVPQQSEDETDG